MTSSFWPGPAWVDCKGEDVGDGKVRCTIRVLGGGTRDIVVSADHFDVRRLKVRVIRPYEPSNGSESIADCPTIEAAGNGWIIDCPTVDVETSGRMEVLAAFVDPIYG